MKEHRYFVYIITHKDHRSLYIGVTNDLVRRIHEHRTKAAESHTAKYKIDKLIYFEMTDQVESAILREKQLKGWTRKKKIDLINTMNKEWNDLYETILIN